MESKDSTSKFLSLLQDGKFLLEISKKQSTDEVRKEFLQKGYDLTDEEAEFILKTVKDILNNKVEVSEEDLENISGGQADIRTVLTVIIGVTLAGFTGALVASAVRSGSSPQVAPAPEPQKGWVDNFLGGVKKVANDPTIRGAAWTFTKRTADNNKQSRLKKGINKLTFGRLCNPTATEAAAEALSKLTDVLGGK